MDRPSLTAGRALVFIGIGTEARCCRVRGRKSEEKIRKNIITARIKREPKKRKGKKGRKKGRKTENKRSERNVGKSEEHREKKSRKERRKAKAGPPSPPHRRIYRQSPDSDCLPSQRAGPLQRPCMSNAQAHTRVLLSNIAFLLSILQYWYFPLPTPLLRMFARSLFSHSFHRTIVGSSLRPFQHGPRGPGVIVNLARIEAHHGCGLGETPLPIWAVKRTLCVRMKKGDCEKVVRVRSLEICLYT